MSLVEQFRKAVAKNKDKRESAEAQFSVAYPTRFLVFDYLNGAKIKVNKKDGTKITYNSLGIVDGSMVAGVGRSGCGKTTFFMQAAGNIIRPFPKSALFHEDIEGGTSDMRKRHLLKMEGEEFRNKYICRNTGITAQNFFNRVKSIHDLKMDNYSEYEYDTGLLDADGNKIFKLQPTVVLLDSLAMLMPDEQTDEVVGQMGAPAIARLNTQIMKKIIPLLKMANIILFVINHILPDPSLTPKKAQTAWLRQGERVSGGETAIYLANNFLRFDDGAKAKEDEAFYINGIYVDILLVKSRTANAGKSIKMLFDYTNGFDSDISLLLLLKEKGMVSGGGAWMSFENHPDVKFTQKKFKEKLENDDEFREVFYEYGIKALESLIKYEDINEDTEHIETTKKESLTDMILNRAFATV